LPLPGARDVAAFTMPEVLDRWAAEAASARPSSLATGDNVITMFDVIGEDFWTGGGVTAKKVAAQLRAIGDRPVTVQINSPGGDMFEGIAIYNVLREHQQDVTVQVMGMAASAASIIAMAGDTIQIGTGAFFMIHNCWVFAMGNRHDMAKTAEWLAPFDQAMVDMYAQRTGIDAAQIAAWMDAETWMSGTVAIDRGFADALLPADQIATDSNAGAAALAANELRALELTLVQSGKTRSQARATINRLKGTPGAAPDNGTPGAADPLSGPLQGLLRTLKA